MQWYAVYTKPKSEDAVAGSLENAGIEVFNPRLKQKNTCKALIEIKSVHFSPVMYL